VSPTASGLHQGAHIVVADEKPALLEMIVRTLRGADHCVFQAYDGTAALELALALRQVDLLITNTRMPGLNGPALIRQVRAKLPNLPILYVQNSEYQQSPVPGGLPPDIPTLREPFTAEHLLDAVRPLLDGKRS
jgi:two-component system, cell cycle sensor histidine kinase and response regulator CckA